MSILDLIILSIALAMDAFAVSICKGLACEKSNKRLLKTGLACGLWFGFFQALMPLIGYYLGISFLKYIEEFDHWIAFLLLAFLGVKMIVQAIHDKEEEKNDSIAFKVMILFALATSIDALAAGLSLAALNANIFSGILCIGIITFVFSFVGVWVGNQFGKKWERKAQIVGGVILILIGIKILIEHLFF